MKKLVAIILAAVMAIGMATVAFAEEAPALDGSWPEETIKIAASKAPVFKAGKALKDAVNVKKGKKK